MSIGQDRVRVQFNPSADSIVDQLKVKTAELIDMCQSLRGAPPGDSEVHRLVSLAQTTYEEAAMWAVKAATSNKP